MWNTDPSTVIPKGRSSSDTNVTDLGAQCCFDFPMRRESSGMCLLTISALLQCYRHDSEPAGIGLWGLAQFLFCLFFSCCLLDPLVVGRDSQTPDTLRAALCHAAYEESGKLSCQRAAHTNPADGCLFIHMFSVHLSCELAVSCLRWEHLPVVFMTQHCVGT